MEKIGAPKVVEIGQVLECKLLGLCENGQSRVTVIWGIPLKVIIYANGA